MPPSLIYSFPATRRCPSSTSATVAYTRLHRQQRLNGRTLRSPSTPNHVGLNLGEPFSLPPIAMPRTSTYIRRLAIVCRSVFLAVCQVFKLGQSLLNFFDVLELFS